MTKRIIKFFFYFFAPLILIIIYFLRPFILIRLGIIASQRIGHFAGDIELYLSNKKYYRDKNFDIFCFTEKVSNRYLAQLWQRHLFIISPLIIFPIVRLNQFISNQLTFAKKHIIYLKPYDINNIIYITKKNLFFLPNEETLYNKILKDNIVDPEKIVCLIVRDEEYLKKIFLNKDFSYHNYRDCEIDSYIDAVKYLNQLGYTVIRMGKIIKKKMSYSNEKYIEFTESNFFSEFMDIFLAQKCVFTISSGTGWDALPSFVFRKPMVFTNFVPFGHLISSSPNFINLSKNHFSKKSERLLSISEIFNLFGADFESYNKNSIILKDNTSEEIKLSVKEMVEKFLIKKEYFDKENNLNNLFWKIYKENIFYLNSLKKNTNMVKSHGKFLARYSVDYLNNNPNFLK